MEVKTIGMANYQTEVVEAKQTVLLDFWAPWCAPCRMTAPILEDIAKERPDVLVGKVNVDEEGELAAQFRIMSIPMLVVMREGEVVNKAVGLHSKEEILEML